MTPIVPCGIKELLYFAVCEDDDAIVVQVNYKAKTFSRFCDGVQISSIEFGHITKVTTDANTSLEFFNSSPEEAGRNIFTCQNAIECAALYEVLRAIADANEKKGSVENIQAKCEAVQPKICLRWCVVTQKSIKKKSKKSLFKKSKKAISQGSVPDVSLLVMTESQIFCFEEKTREVPLYICPLRGLEIKESDDKDMSFSSPIGIKFSFHCTTADDRQLFIDAREKARNISDQETTRIGMNVHRMRSLFSGTFNKESADDVAILRRLWDASELGINEGGGEPYEFQIQCNRWKDLGFQRDDPISDLRATGMLGMDQLVYFCERYPSLFLEMYRHQQQGEDGMEYPFCTAGINITYLLVELFRLRKDENWCPQFATHPIMFHSESAFDDLYCIIFRLFDQKWNQMKVGYMGFQKVIDEVRESVEDLLNRCSIDGVPAIFDMLGILLEDLSAFKANAVTPTLPSLPTLPSISSSRPRTPVEDEEGDGSSYDGSEADDVCDGPTVSFGSIERIESPKAQGGSGSGNTSPGSSLTSSGDAPLLDEDMSLKAKPRKRRSMSKSSISSPIFCPDEEDKRQTILVTKERRGSDTTQMRAAVPSLPPPSESPPMSDDGLDRSDDLLSPGDDRPAPGRKRRNTKGHLNSWRKKLTGGKDKDKEPKEKQ